MQKVIVLIFEILLLPLVVISAFTLKIVRKYLITPITNRSIFTRGILEKIGVFPIIDHYYEPHFRRSALNKSLQLDRDLPGIDFNLNYQLDLLNKFEYQDEIKEIINLPKDQYNYQFDNGVFLSGDSEILYNMVRYFKPKKIIEVGCGQSTKMIQHAINKNKAANNNCSHTCIEPFENPWLDNFPIEILRKKIENCDKSIFLSLEKNDILFIDSTHMIRPQGDVLFEYLELLPILKPGVIIHIHDIFSPKDYLNEWLNDGLIFWNEQYLLEAFLSNNRDFQVICAVNYLKHQKFTELKAVCPMIEMSREPGSFWIQKVN